MYRYYLYTQYIYTCIICTHSYHCCLSSIRANKTVFSSFLKLASELLLQRNSTGRLFQEQGPDTANALGPIVLVLHAGTTNIPDAAERRCARPVMDDTRVQCLARYRGSCAFKHRKFVFYSGPYIKPVQTSVHFIGDMAVPRFL